MYIHTLPTDQLHATTSLTGPPLVASGSFYQSAPSDDSATPCAVVH